MKPNFLSKINPFRKKSPTDQLISTLSESVTSMFQYQMNDTMSSAMNSMSREFSHKGAKTLKEEQSEQNQIYASAISITNGNRDDIHRVPDQIPIDNFQGDKMDPIQRADAQDIIDIINEANQINGTGMYRTDDDVVEEKNELSATGSVVADMFNGIMDFFTPIARSVAACLGAVISILILTKMTRVVESIG